MNSAYAEGCEARPVRGAAALSVSQHGTASSSARPRLGRLVDDQQVESAALAAAATALSGTRPEPGELTAYATQLVPWIRGARPSGSTAH